MRSRSSIRWIWRICEGRGAIEVSSAWHPEMLKVQAVAARTYALYNKMLSAARDYDVMATIQDQVYRGRTRVDHRVEEAVESTRGIVVTHQQAPIYAAFSSTAAGPTEDGECGLIKISRTSRGRCPFDLESPYYQWKASVKIEQLEKNLRHQGFAVGTIATITPIAFSRAGRVARLRILHSGGETLLQGEDLRKAGVYCHPQYAIRGGIDRCRSGVRRIRRRPCGGTVPVGQKNWLNSDIPTTVFCSITILERNYVTRPYRS